MTEDTPGGSPWFFGGVGYDVKAMRAQEDPAKKADRDRKLKVALATLDLPLSALADTAITTVAACAVGAALVYSLKGDSEDDTPDIPAPPDASNIRALRGD